jgi:hypothetical protein
MRMAGKFGLVILWLAISGHVALAQQVKWELRRQTTSSVCHVQRSDSLPKLGELMSTHDTRKAACQQAKLQFDSSMSDQSKCWSYGGGTKTGCKNDGVDLP